MTKPLVSVVIPVYNAEKYLDRCLHSIVEQTYSELEIILVDDGSCDKSPDICDGWADKDSRISVIHKENTGAGLTRNVGMDLATGEYLLFVDCDDYIALNTVEKCVACARQNSSDVVLFGSCTVSPDGDLRNVGLHPSAFVFVGEDIINKLLPGLFSYEMGYGIGLPTKMFRLSTIRNSGIRIPSEREVASEDAFFILQLFSKVSAVSLINENLYYYYENDKSFSRSFNFKRRETNDAFLFACMQYVESVGYPEIVSRHIKVRYHSYTIAYMKQVLASKLSKKEKKAELYRVLKNPVLRGTLSSDVLNLEKKSLKLFFELLRCRMYFMCFLLLCYRMHGEF